MGVFCCRQNKKREQPNIKRDLDPDNILKYMVKTYCLIRN